LITSGRLVAALPRTYDASRERYETLVPGNPQIGDVGRERDALLALLIIFSAATRFRAGSRRRMIRS
jgi:hypothetical protein